MDAVWAEFASDFAHGIELADSKRPQAVSQRSKKAYNAGIGPHSEAQTIKLVMNELATLRPDRYANHALGYPYPSTPRLSCDICIGTSPDWDYWMEAKLLRLLGDNGKLNDNMVMHILSPYAEHRSALTDTQKLIDGEPPGRKGLLIFGYESQNWPMDVLIDTFEALVDAQGTKLSTRFTAEFSGLMHPIHSDGRVFLWEVHG